MDLYTHTGAPSSAEADLLVIPVAQGEAADAFDRLVESMQNALRRAADDFTGKPKETLLVYASGGGAQRVMFVGLGERDDVTLEGVRRAVADAGKEARSNAWGRVASALPEVAGADVRAVAQALVEGLVLGQYQYTRYKTSLEAQGGGIASITLVVDEADAELAESGGRDGVILAEAASTARDLVNASPHDKTATLLAKMTQQIGERAGFEVEVWDADRIRREKMGGLLGVNRGSVEPPTFSILRYQPDDAVNGQPIVLVGKGVVYDTGGLSLKPSEAMEKMKSDMGGAAAVIGAFEAIARLELPVNVIGLIPASDNRPGMDAYVPGDVLTMHSGATVEVLNTDAEGRLLLADALSYARALEPELVIDLATLTGAAVVALGLEAAALMRNDETAAREAASVLAEVGETTGERVHALPMYPEYAELLKSDVADLKNIGGRAAGSITAGKFLEHFVAYPWVHLDIAGTAFAPSAKPYKPIGGTGFGVRLLAAFLQSYSQPRWE
jgi:leucyl aminopeptidase